MLLMFRLMLLLQVSLFIMAWLGDYDGLEIQGWSHFRLLRYIALEFECCQLLELNPRFSLFLPLIL